MHYDLDQMDPVSFEHLVNLLALHVLGLGHTGFGPGADGGRDGFFEGEAPYPSQTDRWTGTWYLQAKFHKPHLSADPQKWLLQQIDDEIKSFADPKTRRSWPDNWIIATNIDPSGVPATGSFDRARAMVGKAQPKLGKNFHIWGGRKLLDLLTVCPNAAKQYFHHLTPGHVLSELYEHVLEDKAGVETILHFLIVRQLEAQQHTRLEQAGSAADARPGIHRLFIDLPFRTDGYEVDGLLMENLIKASAWVQRLDERQPGTKAWVRWRRHPSRARVWFVRGGPGQGKSTIGQYFCQIQRAALLLEDVRLSQTRQRGLALEIKEAAEQASFWPRVPRIPISVELKDFAQWYGRQKSDSPKGVMTYLAQKIYAGVGQDVGVGTLRAILRRREWFVFFDGLDEVPHDVKDYVALEVRNFIDDIYSDIRSDAVVLCTSRPQGYSGQFSDLDGPVVDLAPLLPAQALECARPVISLNRSEEESEKALQILTSAVQSASVRELMTTPLQSHIMAIVVRDGGKPPDRRWQLYANFYQVIRRREANRDLPDGRLATLLREEESLLKTVHNRLGFILHSRAETSEGAQTHLQRSEFKELVADAVASMKESEVDATVKVLMEATTDRLVLVSTPDDGDHVRFDIRPLQEFFAAEFVYESVDADELRARLEVIAGDSHWREVMHFLLSALVENNRKTELTVAVDVLERLNDADGDTEERLLKRRLARGALLGAKLLREGVLEQDKRTRQQLRSCLEPLAALTNLGTLFPLIEVNQPSSLAWLLNFLIDKVVESSPAESIGAAIVLAFTLPGDHLRVPEVVQFFNAAPIAYVARVVANSSRSVGDLPAQQWVVEPVLRALLSPDWRVLNEADLKSMRDVLRHYRKYLRRVARKLKMSQSLVRAMFIFIDSREGYNDKDKSDYGVVELFHPPLPSIGKLKASGNDLFVDPGETFLHFVLSAIRCIETGFLAVESCSSHNWGNAVAYKGSSARCDDVAAYQHPR